MYPAALDREATVKKLDSYTSKPPCLDKYKENLKNNRRIFGKLPIGQVIAASGMRTNGNNRIMDEILIQVPGKTSKNNPPPRTSHSLENSKASIDAWPEDYKITTDSIICQFGDMSVRLWVVKRGRTTGTTSGSVNQMTRSPGPSNGVRLLEGLSRNLQRWRLWERRYVCPLWGFWLVCL